MARVISIVNQKGGVGKTTTSVNLASSLTYEGKKVLLIDLDPQGNATTSLGIRKGNLEFSSYDFFINNVKLEDTITSTKFKNIDMIAGTVDLSNIEIKILEKDEREYILYRGIQEIKDQYDYILIDCPPSLGTLSKNAMLASHSVIIPVQCEFFAIEGLTQLLNTLRVLQKKQQYNKRTLEIQGILLTMLDNRSNFGYEVVNEVKTHFGEKVFKSIIPRNIQAQIAPSHGQPVTEYAPTSPSSKMYKELAKEVVSQSG